MSTRFTRRESSFGECKRIGEIVGAKAAGMLKGEEPYVPLVEASLKYHTVNLKRAVTPSPEDAASKLKAAEENFQAVIESTDDPAVVRRAQSYIEGASINLLKSSLPQDGLLQEIPIRVGLLTLNNRKIVCSPFELFSTLALRLKGKADVEMFGYVNEHCGYLADTAAYDNMEYEALFSDYAPGEGEAYIEEVLKLI